VSHASEGKLQEKVAMYILQETCMIHYRRKINVEVRAETVIYEKWSNTRRRMRRVIIGELDKWEVNLVILLVAKRAPQVLF
jgi:hypothetical protein